ncbi:MULTISPECIES: phosphopyruvate hydratase [Candidatus Nitrosocaldus]|jgi:enolase|uniref:Enolase n=1 Tax=Candidatus Nitrosocaldus cavascurensis TaxID=2058097 RepID=A0A2K5AST2_9ARCH|nr:MULTISPECIES: enolase C-terminal domain-like protein [Candidatus Nitrosocaldus]SPC34679.1 enolase [Candidatus Nitrosocaldus cavascurensis]
MEASITAIKARLCYNSRGQESIEVDVVTDGKYMGRASAPSGASKGRYEAVGFPNNSVEDALKVFNENKSRFIGVDASDPKAIYDVLRGIDSTPNYSIVGGSVAYAVSMAAVDSASKALSEPIFRLISIDRRKEKGYRLPYPLGNVLGGGAHAGPSTPDIQEYLVVPIGAKNMVEAVRMNVRVHRVLRDVLERKDRYFTYGRGDEGAWAPRASNMEALEAVEQACIEAGYSIGKDVALGIDFASSSLWDGNGYVYARYGNRMSKEEQIEFVSNLIRDYRLIYVEDPLHEEDFSGMAELTKRFSSIYITGDDLLVTNVSRLRVALEYKACNSAILKVNQAGSLYEALLFAREADEHGIRLVTSHRSGESIDAHIAHVAVATGSKMIKAGVVGGERVAKMNELIRLEELDMVDGMTTLQ